MYSDPARKTTHLTHKRPSYRINRLSIPIVRPARMGPLQIFRREVLASHPIRPNILPMTVSTLDFAAQDSQAGGAARIRLGLFERSRPAPGEPRASSRGGAWFRASGRMRHQRTSPEHADEVDVFVLDFQRQKTLSSAGGARLPMPESFCGWPPTRTRQARRPAPRQGAALNFSRRGSSRPANPGDSLVASAKRGSIADSPASRGTLTRTTRTAGLGLRSRGNGAAGVGPGPSNRKIAGQIGVSDPQIKNANVGHLFHMAGWPRKANWLGSRWDGSATATSAGYPHIVR